MIEKTEQKHENVGERRGTGKKGDAGEKNRVVVVSLTSIMAPRQSNIRIDTDSHISAFFVSFLFTKSQSRIISLAFDKPSTFALE